MAETKRGRKSDKVMGDAIRLALNDKDKTGTKYIRRIAQALVIKAAEGDVAAIREVADRVDGKPAQAIVGDNSRDPITLIERVIIG